jgi:hypothetical protein
MSGETSLQLELSKEGTP